MYGAVAVILGVPITVGGICQISYIMNGDSFGVGSCWGCVYACLGIVGGIFLLVIAESEA